jgi:hypothetical protein
VNGRAATRIAFPSTADEKDAGAVWIESRIDRSGSNNVLVFSIDCGSGPVIRSIGVQ